MTQLLYNINVIIILVIFFSLVFSFQMRKIMPARQKKMADAIKNRWIADGTNVVHDKLVRYFLSIKVLLATTVGTAIGFLASVYKLLELAGRPETIIYIICVSLVFIPLFLMIFIDCLCIRQDYLSPSFRVDNW